MTLSYAELHAHSAYTFLDGADLPHVLVEQAHQLGLSALGVLDIDGMYSAIQTSTSARAIGLPTVFGAELTLATGQFDFNGSSLEPDIQSRMDSKISGQRSPRTPRHSAGEMDVRLPILAKNIDGYTDLCRAMSQHILRRPGQRHSAHLLEELADENTGNWFILTGTSHGPIRRALKGMGRTDIERGKGFERAQRAVEILIEHFGSSSVIIESSLQPHDPPDLADALAALSEEFHLPLVGTTAARCASPKSLALADVLIATRMNKPLTQVESYLPAFGTFLRSAEEMMILHHRHPRAIGTAAEIAADIQCDLSLLKPRLPSVDVPSGYTPDTWLEDLTRKAAIKRYGHPDAHPVAWKVINRELEIIKDLQFSSYFLIVKEIVDFCVGQRILCQGRGSAANSAVCFVLGITAVDAVKHRMLFERFLSSGRSEPPDIDLDIESDRREEVIQHVYGRYGRHRAAQVATVINYRPSSALRDAARALGYTHDVAVSWGKRARYGGTEGREHFPSDSDFLSSLSTSTHEAAIPPSVTSVAKALLDNPRHMGIHPCGMVLADQPISHICPVTWADTRDRSVLQWDKDDCADAGLVKFDLLGLGMLSALRRSFDGVGKEKIRGRDGCPLGLHNLTEEDPRVFDLLCAADTVGVFQVESRAQMSTLPRIQPRCFYDIVIEVALIRPGPIQGKSVNPYIRRKQGKEKVSYAHLSLRPALERTLGVPLFQEQLMQISQDAAGFTASQADELRRAMGSKRSKTRMEQLKVSLLEGMSSNGVPESVAQSIYEMLKGFANFGFPESHAVSFAHIVYASAWLKVHYPEHFYASILASQPMGFYSPDTLIHDAQRHGVLFRSPDIQYSIIETTVLPIDTKKPLLEPGMATPQMKVDHISLDTHPNAVIQLGLEMINGIGENAERIVRARNEGGPFRDIEDLTDRCSLNASCITALSRSGALAGLGMSRREGIWLSSAYGQSNPHQPYLTGLRTEEPIRCPAMSKGEEVCADYRSMGVTIEDHPFSLSRVDLEKRGVKQIAEVKESVSQALILTAGVITHRQRPTTAGGMTFLSLEDETGLINVICTKNVWRQYRKIFANSYAIIVCGQMERDMNAVSVRAHSAETLHFPYHVRSRDFH